MLTVAVAIFRMVPAVWAGHRARLGIPLTVVVRRPIVAVRSSGSGVCFEASWSERKKRRSCVRVAVRLTLVAKSLGLVGVERSVGDIDAHRLIVHALQSRGEHATVTNRSANENRWLCTVPSNAMALRKESASSKST